MLSSMSMSGCSLKSWREIILLKLLILQLLSTRGLICSLNPSAEDQAVKLLATKFQTASSAPKNLISDRSHGDVVLALPACFPESDKLRGRKRPQDKLEGVEESTFSPSRPNSQRKGKTPKASKYYHYENDSDDIAPPIAWSKPRQKPSLFASQGSTDLGTWKIRKNRTFRFEVEKTQREMQSQPQILERLPSSEASLAESHPSQGTQEIVDKTDANLVSTPPSLMMHQMGGHQMNAPNKPTDSGWQTRTADIEKNVHHDHLSEWPNVKSGKRPFLDLNLPPPVELPEQDHQPKADVTLPLGNGRLKSTYNALPNVPFNDRSIERSKKPFNQHFNTPSNEPHTDEPPRQLPGTVELIIKDHPNEYRKYRPDCRPEFATLTGHDRMGEIVKCSPTLGDALLKELKLESECKIFLDEIEIRMTPSLNDPRLTKNEEKKLEGTLRQMDLSMKASLYKIKLIQQAFEPPLFKSDNDLKESLKDAFKYLKKRFIGILPTIRDPKQHPDSKVRPLPDIGPLDESDVEAAELFNKMASPEIKRGQGDLNNLAWDMAAKWLALRKTDHKKIIEVKGGLLHQYFKDAVDDKLLIKALAPDIQSRITKEYKVRNPYPN